MQRQLINYKNDTNFKLVIADYIFKQTLCMSYYYNNTFIFDYLKG